MRKENKKREATKKQQRTWPKVSSLYMIAGCICHPVRLSFPFNRPSCDLSKLLFVITYHFFNQYFSLCDLYCLILMLIDRYSLLSIFASLCSTYSHLSFYHPFVRSYKMTFFELFVRSRYRTLIYTLFFAIQKRFVSFPAF